MFSQSEYKAIREHTTTLSVVAGAFDLNAGYIDGDVPIRTRVQAVTENFFDVFPASVQAGRTIASSDFTRPDIIPAVLSHSFLTRQYAGDLRVLGRKVLIQGHPFVVVGVTAAGFNSVSIESSPDVWVPVTAADVLFTTEEDRRRYELDVFARLRPGVSLERARDETYALFRAALEAEAGSAGENHKRDELLTMDAFRLERIPTGVSRFRTQVSTTLTFLLIAVGLLLVMVDVNVAGLLLAHFASRGRDFAVRLAVGASAASLVRFAGFTSLMLATAGTAVGIIVTLGCAPTLPRLLPPIRLADTTTVLPSIQVVIDWRVLAFAVGLCLVTMLIVGSAPAIHAARTDIETVLRAARSSASGRGRALLVVAQICLSTSLIIAALEFGTSLAKLRSIDPGFASDRIVSFTMDSGLAAGDPAQTNASIAAAKEQVKTLPAVRGAALAGRGLLRGSGIKTTIAPAGQKVPRSDFLNTSIHSVTPDYFETLGIRFLAGRNFSPSELIEKQAPPRPVIVNEAFAHRFFPGESALGKAVGSGLERTAKAEQIIIGMVTNAKYRSLREPIQPTIYGPYVPGAFPGPAVLHVRTESAPETVIASVRDLLRRFVPAVPVYEVTTLAEDIEASLSTDKLLARLGALFAGLASLVSAAGIFAMLAFSVESRRREIGIRVAVGAAPSDILWLLAKSTSAFTTAGILAGILVAIAGTPVLRSLLYEVSPMDTRAVALTVVFVVASACVSAAVPVLRALTVQPGNALRDE